MLPLSTNWVVCVPPLMATTVSAPTLSNVLASLMLLILSTTPALYIVTLQLLLPVLPDQVVLPAFTPRPPDSVLPPAPVMLTAPLANVVPVPAMRPPVQFHVSAML